MMFWFLGWVVKCRMVIISVLRVGMKVRMVSRDLILLNILVVFCVGDDLECEV